MANTQGSTVIFLCVYMYMTVHVASDTIICHAGDEITRLRDLVYAVKDIGDWKGLCTNLDVDLGTLDGIEHSPIYDKKWECLTAYLKQGEARWSDVVRAVAMLGNKLVAKKIAKKHGIDFEKVVRDEL